MITRESKVIIEVGAFDELPSKVVDLPDKSEYRCCLADMIHGGVCDKGVNTDPIRRKATMHYAVIQKGQSMVHKTSEFEDTTVKSYINQVAKRW